MSNYSEINKILETLIHNQKQQFVIYPFGEMGLLTKQILNQQFGIKEKFLVDNEKCKTNSEIKSIGDLANIDCSEYTFLIASNSQIYFEEIRENIRKYIPDDNIVDLFPRKVPGRMIPASEFASRLKKNHSLIIFGTGKKGKEFGDFFQFTDTDFLCYCSMESPVNRKIGDKQVLSFEQTMSAYPESLYLIAAESRDEGEAMANKLIGSHCIYTSVLSDCVHPGDSVAYHRDYTAFFHIHYMDRYFDEAENDLDIFWNPDTQFYLLFQQLDITNIVELACGRGRHVPKYMDKASQITLVDVLDKNIEYCKERFSNHPNVLYYCNNGRDLSALESEAYTALFSYDAMVHFEMMDIYEYLKETYRILDFNGMALFHHSNYHADYRCSGITSFAPHGRNYMSKDIFAYLAYRAGFVVKEQKVIHWGEGKNYYPAMDCITLLQKR